MVYLEILAGLLLLLAGGEFLVRGAVAVAQRLGVSPLMIGLTLVGFGTSTPELMASVQAALAGSPGIAVGNVVGSNVANILLILGLSAAILPIAVAPGPLRRDGLVAVLAAALLVALGLAGHVGRGTGAAMVALLLGYVYWVYLGERTAPDASPAAGADDGGGPPMALGAGLLVAAGGLAGVVLGADLLVGGAILLAGALGVPDTVVGLTLVAVGTSLPEMVTSVMAAVRRQADVAFGNIVGSNIYNVLGILGVTALVQPVDVPAQIVAFDMWVMLAATVLLVAFAVTGSRVGRREGWAFMGLYAAYLGVQVSPAARAALGLG